MSFKILLTQKIQIDRSVETLYEDYKGKHKGRIYHERLRILKDKAIQLKHKIDNYGKGFVYNYKFTLETPIGLKTRNTVVLTMPDMDDVATWIEHTTGGKVISINRDYNTLGKIFRKNKS